MGVLNKYLKTIHTVIGEIEPEALGYCQCHEHLFIAKGKSYEINPTLWMDDIKASTNELTLYKNAGGSSLVDAQPVGAGAMPEALLKVSKKTGVNIIASTGFHKILFYNESHWVFSLSEQQLAERFIADIEIGMALEEGINPVVNRCSSRAGIIKCALDRGGLDERYRRLFTAAAKVAIKTGAPLMIHTEDGVHSVELIDYLIRIGVPPNRIIICHADRNVDNIAEKIKIAEKGVYLECDTIARYKYHSDEVESKYICRLCSEGFEDRLLLGLDTHRQRLKNYGGDVGLDYIIKNFLPLVKKAGVSDMQINKICVINPADALAFEFKSTN